MTNLPQRKCQRCGVAAEDTEMGMLALNGALLVCDDCNSDIDNEWAAEDRSRVHPIDALCPAAHVAARLRA